LGFSRPSAEAVLFTDWPDQSASTPLIDYFRQSNMEDAVAEMTWKTSIADVLADDVIIRGHRLSDLVGEVSYIDMAFLLIRGTMPSSDERSMLEAIFVSLVEHGISPSTMIARTLASCGTPVQASMAGAILSIADWHGGSGEEVAQILSSIATKLAAYGGIEDGVGLRDMCEELVAGRLSRNEQVPGFGHPQHAEGDPRARHLLELASTFDVAGTHCRVLTALGQALARATAREALRLPNITGAIAGLLLDLGFPWSSARGIVISARCLGLTAHVVEELEQGNKWRHLASDSVEYIGPPAAL
jgi:citrate synthase